MENIDYLVNNLEQPSLLFFNSQITKKGLIPEVFIFGLGLKVRDEIDLFDRENNLICRVAMPYNLIGEMIKKHIIRVKINLEFIITKVYVEPSIF